MVTGIANDSEKAALRYQQKFINDAIEQLGSQHRIANMLCITQQTVSKWRDGSNALTLSKMIRIAKLQGKSEVVITW